MLRHVLPNGLVVIATPCHAAELVTVQLWIRSGSIHEGRHLGAGISHALEHMVFKGTPDNPGNALSAGIQAVGGSLNAYTSLNRTVYHADVPAAHAGLALRLLADAVFNASIPADEFAKERDVILREIDMYRDDPDSVHSEALLETAFRTHPYRHPVIGHRSLFSALDRDALADYKARRYTAANAVLVVGGAIDPEAVVALAGEHLGGLGRRPVEPVLVPGEAHQLAPREARLSGKVQVCRGALAWKIPGLSHPDNPALMLLAGILGRGQSSLLWDKVRNRESLAHGISANCWSPGDTGLLSIHYTCDCGRHEAVTGSIREAIGALLSEGVAPALLDKVRRQVLVGLINTRATIGGLANLYGTAEVTIEDIGYPEQVLERLSKVTPEAIADVAARHLVESVRSDVTLDKDVPASTAAAAKVRKPEPFTQVRLPNEARILWQRDASIPKFAISVVHLGGPCREPADRRGLNGLAQTLVTLDTARRSAAQVAEGVESLGGTFSEFTGMMTTGLRLEFLSQDFEAACDFLDQALHHPSFDAKSFATERDAQIASIAEADDDIDSVGDTHLRTLFFGTHPYRVDEFGIAADLRRATPADCRKLWKSIATGCNTVVGIAGDFDPATALPRLAGILGALPAGSDVPPPPAIDGAARPGTHVLARKFEQTLVIDAYPCCGVRADDHICACILQDIAGDMSSPLFTKVREDRGLAYYVHARTMLGENSGLFALRAGTHAQAAPTVFAEFDAEVARWCAGGIGEEELERCRLRLSVAHQSSRQHIHGRAFVAARNAAIGTNWNDDYEERLKAVTPARLRDFAVRHFRTEARVRLTVGPASTAKAGDAVNG